MGTLEPSKLSAPVPLSPEHQLLNFSSGEPTLDDWLKKRALKNQVGGASRCFVVCQDSEVVAYYSLSAGAISHELAPKNLRRNMPDPLPILLLGRLAVDRRCQGQGLGRGLLRDALLRAVNISTDAGVFALLVHALSPAARAFYLAHGFVESPIQPMTLMMTLSTARAVLSEA